MKAPGSRPLQPRDNLPPRRLRREDAADPGSSSKSQPVSLLLRDQEEDPKAAKTRVLPKQLKRKQKPLEKNGQEADLGNG